MFSAIVLYIPGNYDGLLFHMDILPYGKFADSPVAQNEWKKHPYMFFLFLVKKKRVWAEKIGKIRKNSEKFQNQKNAGNYPNISFSIFFMNNKNNEL